ncbi:DUF3231 family protein [Neobacillus sp. MER 74]|uniref:DUF3231 family protein n=1 Tax=Neobacillus sp. MER 74 TaxID=2939566 RepID=UPI002040CC6D|nr:DUF3231 family protein [Neobacillus sp. MER 74]MCM3118848.1 DUF3231 family protein [Neobacillus sp. MER 74]
MNSIPLSATELGNLWQAYREKSMLLRVLEYFILKSTEDETKEILRNAYTIESKNEEKIRTIFKNADAVIPNAFNESDVNKNAPQLFDDNYAIMYVRTMGKVLSGLYTLHEGMSYRQDIRDLYMEFTTDMQHIYSKTTEHLLDKGVLPRPPIVPMPKEVDFINDISYTNGLNPFRKKRPLNTVEIGLVYQSLETNLAGMRLMNGFEQVAKESDVKKYFTRGKELAKEIVSMMSNHLLDSDIPAPSTWAGMVTDSTIPPFSDKLMMYNTSLLSNFGLGSNSIGAAFSFRSDLLLNMGSIMAKTYDFAKDGGKILIKYGWLEEPPSASNRA